MRVHQAAVGLTAGQCACPPARPQPSNIAAAQAAFGLLKPSSQPQQEFRCQQHNRASQCRVSLGPHCFQPGFALGAV